MNDVRFKNSRGVLSRAQSKAIFEKMKSKSPDSDVLERHIAVEQALTENPLSVGNQVVLLEDRLAALARKHAARVLETHVVHIRFGLQEIAIDGRRRARAREDGQDRDRRGRPETRR